MKFPEDYRYFGTLATLAVVAIQFITCSLAIASYSAGEVEAIQQLRIAVGGDLEQDYMKTDEFLLPWLKARNLDIQKASEMLMGSIKWRKENHMDIILDDQDLKVCDTAVPFESNAVDNGGRPVLVAAMGSWDVRKLVLAGKSDLVIRCLMRMFETMQVKVTKQNEKKADGADPITQITIITDMSGYNLRKVGCLTCISAFARLGVLYEANFPGITSNVYIINSPAIFEPFLEILGGVLTQSTKDSMHLFGYNQDEWKAALLEVIPSDQLTPRYGGTRKVDTLG